MAGLSSNWKKLQAKLKAESASEAPSNKRKAGQETVPPSKRSKLSKGRPKKALAQSTAKDTPAAITNGKSISARSMGGVQSNLEKETKLGPSASLALWAQDNDISAEALAEAYDLGVPDNSMMTPSEKDKVNHGLSAGIEIGKYIAIDCEMVGVGPGGHESSLARVSMVDFHGRQVYDSYVKQRESVTDWRTAFSGVSRKEMRFARDFDEVQQQVHDILKDRVLIGHDVKHDLEALMLSHPPRNTRDTARYNPFRRYGNGRKPALRILAREILNTEIQEGAHSSIEDARATMLLFRKHKPGFDVEHANHYKPKTVLGTSSRGKGKSRKQQSA